MRQSRSIKKKTKFLFLFKVIFKLSLTNNIFACKHGEKHCTKRQKLILIYN